MKQYIKETRFYHHTFLFFMCDDLSFINTTQKTLKPSKKNVSILRMDKKKLHTREFQLKGIGGKMTCKLLQKRPTGKTTECSRHLRHIVIEKDIFSEVRRCIFQISLKSIKLVIPKIVFILVICSFNFYFKITWPPNKTTPPPTKIKISDPHPSSKDFFEIFNLAPLPPTPPPPPSWRGEGSFVLF